MNVTKHSGTILAVVLWWLAIARSETIALDDTGELALIERIENSTIQALELLNDTNPYNMAMTISANVADVLKLFSDLGQLFRNGTLATNICTRDRIGQENCDIFALPNGSVPLKKSVSRLMYDVFHMTQLKYGAPGSYLSNPVDVIENWLPPRPTDRRNESFYRFDLERRLNEEVIKKPWRHYEHLLGFWGLECLIKSTWHNNTARNLTASDDLREFRTILLNWACYPARPGLVEVLYAFMGPNCAKCLPEFLIRYNNYNESVYKTFVEDVSTFLHLEITLVGFGLGICRKGDDVEAERYEQERNRLAEQVREIMKHILDARTTLNEEPPTKPTKMTTHTTTESSSSEPPTSNALEESLIDRINDHRIKAIKLLNETDAYDMATTISASVADFLTFFDDLGPFFTNGTLATYMCMQDDDGQRQCDIYALPNGSAALKKSVVKFIFDVFHVTQHKYGDAVNVARKWFPPRATGSQYEVHYRNSIVNILYRDVVLEIWTYYKNYLLGDQALGLMAESTWRNNTGRNLTTWNDFNEFRTFFLSVTCSRPGFIKVLYALMGPQCADETDSLGFSIYSAEIASRGNFNGGDTNRCLPDFLIRYSNYDEVIYKKFVKDVSTFIHHELTMAAFFLGICGDDNSSREQRRGKLSEQVRGIMKYLLDARSVLSEEPPTTPTTITELPSNEAVKAEVTNALASADKDIASLPWKDRPALYEIAVRNGPTASDRPATTDRMWAPPTHSTSRGPVA